MGDAGQLWERAARTANTSSDWATAIKHARRAREYYLEHGRTRAAARAEVIGGQALTMWGRLVESRERLTAVLEVLRAEPDTDTVRALRELAWVEVITGSSDADRLSAEALILGQDLDLDAHQLSELLLLRGAYLRGAERRPEAVAYIREATRLAEEGGDSADPGHPLIDLSDVLLAANPTAAAEAARAAAGHVRRAGNRKSLVIAITNLAQALLMLGDWDAAEAALTQAADADGLADIEFLVCFQGLLAALRGDAPTAETMLAEPPDLRASEDPRTSR